MRIPFKCARTLRRSTSKYGLVAVGLIAALALSGAGAAAIDNPFNLSGPVEGKHSEFGVPAFTASPTAMTTSELHATNPRAGVLANSDAARFTESRASITSRADGKFLSTAEYTANGSVIRIDSWTPDGPFTLFAPLSSPVKEIKQTSIAGNPAVTLLPTADVVGGNAPRQAYVAVNGTWYSIAGEGLTDNQQMLNIVQRVVAGVSAQAPGAPSTGTGVSGDHQSPVWPIAAGAALLAAAGVLGLGLRRRTSHSRA